MQDLQSTNAICRTLSDPSRIRLLRLVEQASLSVAELVRITGLAQSRVSTHLGWLKKAGLVETMRAGSTSLYTASDERMAEQTRVFWRHVRSHLADPLLDGDETRLAEALEARAAKSSWAETVAGHMERHYSPGRTWEATARAFVGFAELGEVLDIASGDGVLAELLAPRARHVTCYDISAEVIAAGERRLERFDNVRFVQGDMHDLPFDDRRFDQVLALNALSYAKTPQRVIAEAARVLRDGGRFVAITLARHAHVSTAQAFNHENQGFEAHELRTMLTGANFEIEQLSVTHSEKRAPHFEVMTINAKKTRNDT